MSVNKNVELLARALLAQRLDGKSPRFRLFAPSEADQARTRAKAIDRDWHGLVPQAQALLAQIAKTEIGRASCRDRV
jgi:hypothetical protein